MWGEGLSGLVVPVLAALSAVYVFALLRAPLEAAPLHVSGLLAGLAGLWCVRETLRPCERRFCDAIRVMITLSPAIQVAGARPCDPARALPHRAPLR